MADNGGKRVHNLKVDNPTGGKGGALWARRYDDTMVWATRVASWSKVTIS